MKDNLQKAYFGGGCFWCTEAVFSELAGVVSVISGYAGGHTQNPTYYQVGEGNTGHAEVIEVIFDSEKISYTQLLDVFFHTHNPTTLNQQGADRGPEYRSIILTTSEEHYQAATAMKKEFNDTRAFEQMVVTEIRPLEAFYPAEDSHQKFYQRNSESMYCQVVIAPKMDHFQRRYQLLLKNS